MFAKFLVVLLYQIWNKITELQKPVKYEQVETNNNHRFKHEVNGCVLIFEVKQLRECRIPKFPFLRKTVYQYAVTQYAFKDGVFTNAKEDKIPEFCNWVFRNTKIPHLMAVNAFLAGTNK